MCIEKAMVSGLDQVIDSLPEKANVSMDSLGLIKQEEKLRSHITKGHKENDYTPSIK